MGKIALWRERGRLKQEYEVAKVSFNLKRAGFKKERKSRREEPLCIGKE